MVCESCEICEDHCHQGVSGAWLWLGGGRRKKGREIEKEI